MNPQQLREFTIAIVEAARKGGHRASQQKFVELALSNKLSMLEAHTLGISVGAALDAAGIILKLPDPNRMIE